jgi:hypothetical protein
MIKNATQMGYKTSYSGGLAVKEMIMWARDDVGVER